MHIIEKPIRKTYPLKTYLSELKERDIRSDQEVQRSAGRWNKGMTNELVFTILTDDYIPPIILGEDMGYQKWIIDGLQRSTACNLFRYGNYKITSTIKYSVVKYREKVRDEEGNISWEYKEFDIKGKTFDALPKELQKRFDGYQLETVIHEGCDSERLSELVRRYNNHMAMNPAEKAVTSIGKFAGRIKDIRDSRFFIDSSSYKETEKTNGTLSRIIIESVMCMFHVDKWKKGTEAIAKYLNENSSDEQFDVFAENLNRLEKIITPDLKDIFSSKDSFVWFTLFHKFTKSGIEDVKFAEFLKVFKASLHTVPVNGKLFDEVDKDRSTKDKSVIMDKLEVLESLMNDYLDIDVQDNEQDISIIDFVKENVCEEVGDADIVLYENTLDDLTLNVDNDTKLLEERNRPSLVAMMAYSYEADVDLDTWFVDYFKNHDTYLKDQKKNYIEMLFDLEKYIKEQGETKR